MVGWHWHRDDRGRTHRIPKALPDSRVLSESRVGHGLCAPALGRGGRVYFGRTRAPAPEDGRDDDDPGVETCANIFDRVYLFYYACSIVFWLSNRAEKEKGKEKNVPSTVHFQPKVITRSQYFWDAGLSMV